VQEHSNYWHRRRVSRRAALRGAAIGLSGLAGAALIGCGSSDNGTATTTATTTSTATGSPTATGTGTAGGETPVPADQIRVPPDIYDQPVVATPAEAAPMVNAKYGGTLNALYLDPPRMDINRTLSCTIYSTMNLTNNKVARARTGASAHPFLVEIEPDLAESWEASPDNTEFTFHLRQGIKTHNVDPTNGREFTAEDIKLSMERYQAGGVQSDVFSPVTSIEQPDNYTITVKLDQPLSDFPTNIAAWSFMWPKEMIEGDNPLVEDKAVGTGPFIQEEWTKKERSVFAKHPDYFEEGLPFLDKIIDNVQNDTAALSAGFQTDNFFLWSALDDEDASQMGNKVDDMVLWKFPRSRGANVNGWHFQMTNPVFQDERVRRAVSLAFDRDAEDLARNAGDNQNANGAFSNPPMPWALLYDEYPDQRANGAWYKFDPEQALQLLDAAGYNKDNPLKWEHVTWYDRAPSSEIIIPGIKEATDGVIDISFRQVDNPTQVTLLSDHNFDATIGIVWGPAGFSMDQWIFPWYHTGGSLNYNSAGDTDLDAILERQRASSDPAEKKQLWQQVWDTIHDQVWDLWWPEALLRYAWHNYVINYRPHGWMGNWTCYVSDQGRSVWLDDGAPGLDR